MNTGQIVRAKSVRDFTMIKNEILRSNKLTIEERGLLVYLLSLPEDWVLYKSKLHELVPDSKGTIDRVFKQLQDQGYILSVKVVDTKTKVFKGWNHIVYEEPTLTKPEVREEPRSAFADVGQSAPIQIQSINTNTEVNTNTNSIIVPKAEKSKIKAPKKQFVPPTLEEAIEFFKEKGYKEELAVKAWNYYSISNWHDKNNKPVLNWKLKMSMWFKDDQKISALSPMVKVRTTFGDTITISRKEYEQSSTGYYTLIN